MSSSVAGDRDKELLLEWLSEVLRRRPDDRDVAFMVDVATRDPLVLDGEEEARLHQLGSMFPQGTRAIILRDAALRLLARSKRR